MYPAPEHILFGIQHYGAEFPEHVNESAQLISARLGLSAESLDFSCAGLRELDLALSRLGADALLGADVFLPLVAYVSETVRRSASAEFEMRVASDGVTWEPHVVKGGRDVRPYRTLYDQLTEHSEEDRSIFGAVTADIFTLSRE
jgi:hypothetical protein